ncbi:MAG: extracellular solute-binding protein [Planctomycetes bacterium]|nr:extracellular solute-binding protein [Planctomycetota bacterium]
MAKRVLKHIRIREKLMEEADRIGTDLLPSERDIAASFGVSRMTARKALDSLADDKLVRREVGKGTFLIREPRKTRVSVVILRGPREHPAMITRLAEEYMRRNPEVEVCLAECYGKNWYSEALESRGAKVLIHSRFGYLADMGALLPIDGLDGFSDVRAGVNRMYLEEHLGLDGKRHVFSLPLYYSPTILGYNRRYAKELGLNYESGPESWDELLEWAKVGARFDAASEYSVTEFSRSGRMPNSFYLTLTGGNHYLRKNGDAVEFDFSGGEEWFRLFSRISEIGGLSDYGTGKVSALVQGKSLFSCMVEPWIFRQAEGFGLRDDMAVCPVPPRERGQPSFAQINMWGCAMVRDENATDDEHEEAWKFMRFMTGDVEAQKIVCAALPGFSVMDELYLDQQKRPEWYPFVVAVAMGRVLGDFPIQHTINAVMIKYFQAVLFDGMDHAEAAQETSKICSTLAEIGSDIHALSGMQESKVT